MARIVELKWTCRDCGTKDILGRHKQCPNCGSPREKGEMKMGGLSPSDHGVDGRNKAASVTDPELLKIAGAGADWFCSHCSAGNKGSGDKCGTCGAPRYATAEEDHPDFYGDHRRVKGFDEKLDEETNRDPRPPKSTWTPTPPRRAIPPTFARDPDPMPEDPEPPQAYPEYVPGLILAAVLAVGFVAFIVWAMQTHDVSGSVTAMTWERAVHVERWADTKARLWRHQTTERAEVPPRGGSGERAGFDLVEGSCRDEHYDDERYVCGSHEECEDIYRTERESYTCSKSERYVCGETCRDNGNGFATCNDKYCSREVSDTCYRDKKVFDHKECEDVKDYCTRPIYKERCDYLTQEWKPVGDRASSGHGKDLSWATVAEGDDVRTTYSATYKVGVAYSDRGSQQAHDLVSAVRRTSRAVAEQAARDYLSWNVGDSVKLTVNNLGGVAGVEHAPTLLVEAP